MKRALVLFVALLTAFSLFADNMSDADSLMVFSRGDGANNASGRPKVGIVLAGGGAKGAAHIGVLKYIEELGIPVDYIVGNSMGSIIAGLYALGYESKELTDIIKNVDWNYILGNGVPPEDESYEITERRNKYYLSIPFSFSDLSGDDSGDKAARERNKGELLYRGQVINENSSSAFMRSLPAGFISGNNVATIFNDLCIGYQDSIDFDSLPIPFACIATNVMDGSEVVLRSGKVAYAMRSSMAIPILFAPTDYNGMVLVDGGMVNNFPTDVCREMGADILIGIELTKGFKADPKEYRNLPGMVAQLANMVTAGNNAENRKKCDVYLLPDVSGYGTMSFDAASIDSLVARGYANALLHSEELMAVKNRIEAYGPASRKLNAPRAQTLHPDDTVIVSSVNTEGIDSREYRWIDRKFGFETGKKIPASQIKKSISKYLGTGYYKYVSYNTVSDSDSSGSYHLDMKFEPYAPHRVSVGLRADSEEALVLGLKFGLNENRLGGFKAFLDARISYNPSIEVKASYCIPSVLNLNLSYDYKHRAYLYAHNAFGYEQSMFNSYGRHRVRFYLSEFNSRYLKVKGGVEYERLNIDQIIKGVDFQIDSLNRNAGFFVEALFDNRDSRFAATSGGKVEISSRYRLFSKSYGSYMEELYGDSHKNGDVVGKFEWYVTPARGPVTIIPQLFHRSVFGEFYHLHFNNAFGGSLPGRYLDHQLPFIGVNGIQECTFPNMSIGRMDARWNITGNHYLTAMGNYMIQANKLKNYFRTSSNYEYALSICAGDDTHAKELLEMLELDPAGKHQYFYQFWGIGARYTYVSKLGPISLDVHWSDFTNKVGVYFSFGYDF